MTLTTTLSYLFLSVIDASRFSSVDAVNESMAVHRSCIRMQLANHCDTSSPHDGLHAACM